MTRVIAAAVALAVAVFVVAGCRSSQGPRGDGPNVVRGSAPTYAAVATTYNKRVDPLVRLWARTVVRLKFIDGDGNPQSEQVEGHCQYVRPSRALVSFHKAGRSLALFGANEEQYWWIDLGKKSRAYVGRHENATAERVAAAGLRVHPLDLIELLGLTPLPPAGDGCEAAWSNDGKTLMVTVPARLGTRRLTLDPETHYPSRVELVGEGGKVLAFSELAKFETVAVKGAGPEVARPSIATDVKIEADGGATSVILKLSEPENDPGRIKPIAFDLAKLLEANDVQEVHDLDKEVRPAK